MSADPRRRSPAVARNTDPILRVLRAHLPARGRVLEVASGGGEHALAFAAALPGLDWHPSDPDATARDSIAAHRAAAGTPNLHAPIVLDARDEDGWPEPTFQAVVCINMVHISPWDATQGLMRLAARVLTRPGGVLMLYGPYLEDGVPTAASNLAFDADLRARGPSWGLRSVADVVAQAAEHRLAFTFRHALPANNLALIFRAV